MAVDVVSIGVASSAGAHHAGQDAAPRALRQAGLLDALRSAGVSVEDRGDVLTEVFAVDHESPAARNLPAVVRVARAVADVVAEVVAAGAIPLVIGGDCTITLGVVAGVQRVRPHAGLFYFDGDADLAIPGTGSGVLDAMGIAHLIGLADTELARIGERFPMLEDGRLVLVGVDESDPETFRRAALDAHPGLAHFSDAQVRADPAGCTTEALRLLHQAAAGREAAAGHRAADGDEATGGRGATGEHGAADESRGADGIVLHFDVDAVDSGDLPLGNFPHYRTGVSLEQAGQVLTVAAGAGDLVAIVLTEVNPSHDPGGEQIARYVATVGRAFGLALGR